MSVLGKRRRLDVPVVAFGARVKRPIDKELKVVDQNVTNSQVESLLKTTTFPCTIVGLRWNINVLGSTIATDSTIWWAIVVVKDGLSASTMATSDGADFYTPEQDVLAFGTVGVRDKDNGSGPTIAHFEGNTKTMRKLRGGDLLKFITISETASAALVQGVIQFFCKS